VAGADLDVFESLAGPLVLARDAREFGARVAGASGDGVRLEAAAASSSSPPMMAADVARCFNAAGRLLRLFGGDICEDANASTFFRHAGLTALGLGLSFSTALRLVRGGGGSDRGGGSDSDSDSSARRMAADAAPDCATLVVWLDPEVCAAAGLATAPASNPAEARLLRRRRRQSVRSSGRFRLRFGGGAGQSMPLRHGALLILPPPAEDELSSLDLEEMAVVSAAAAADEGGGGGNNDDDDNAPPPARLIELRFFVSQGVRQACATLGWAGVHRAMGSS
jgi:hypothetical protein